MAKQKIGPWQDAWLRTLESGEFLQCAGTLCMKRPDGQWAFCCLGIGCEVLLENGVDMHVNTSDDANNISYDEAAGFLPAQAVEIYGFYSNNGKFSRAGFYGLSEKERRKFNELIGWPCSSTVFFEVDSSLADMNDNGRTFKQIARLCRAFPQLVFVEPR